MRRQAWIDDGRNAAIDHTEVTVVDRSVFPRLGAEMAAFGGAAPAEIFGAERRVEPRRGRPIERIAKDEAFAAAVADDGDKEAGLANFRSSRGSGVRQPDERNFYEAEIRIDERDFLVDGDARVLVLPGGGYATHLIWIAAYSTGFLVLAVVAYRRDEGKTFG